MSARLYADYVGQDYQKKKSRDAARSRRGQQNDEFLELASQLPISVLETSQLDRLSVMRLANSYVRIKHIVSQLTSAQDFDTPFLNLHSDCDEQEGLLSEALDGFVFVVGAAGRCLYISDNVSTYLGLMPIEIIGNSFYKYIHPCDHEEVAKELCGKIPLEDMEIFDGLFCSDSVFMMSNNLKGGSKDKNDIREQPYRSFFVRMKSTLTSRGKSVNLKASTYRVVHCTGRLMHLSNNCEDDRKESPNCFVGIGVPLMFTPTFEVPLDQATFSSHHSLDLSFVFTETGIEQILGYLPSEVLGKSLYQFLHGCDQDVLSNCHKTLLTKGQSVSGYYRLLAKNGGWIWVQTKASIVYASKSCQPQFVLCVHYAISEIQEEDMLVSLDQVRRKKEMQESPGNSPADGANYYHIRNEKRLPVIRRAYDQKVLQLEKGTEKGGTATNDCFNNELSNMDLSDVGLDEDMSEICEEQSEKYLNSLNSATMAMDDSDRSIGDYLRCPVSLSSSERVLSNLHTESFAPFVPLPMRDTQFTVEEKELEEYNMNNKLCNNDDISWKSEVWEANNELERDRQQKVLIKRNLSTPTFFPLAEKINPEP